MKNKTNLQEFNSNYPFQLAGQIWGREVYVCTYCGKSIPGFKNRVSVQEFKISGFCQECQDKSFEIEVKTI
jgi:formamidopyrimidine-DNA glycosylase